MRLSLTGGSGGQKSQTFRTLRPAIDRDGNFRMLAAG